MAQLGKLDDARHESPQAADLTDFFCPRLPFFLATPPTISRTVSFSTVTVTFTLTIILSAFTRTQRNISIIVNEAISKYHHFLFRLSSSQTPLHFPV